MDDDSAVKAEQYALVKAMLAYAATLSNCCKNAGNINT
jgi:hypothetical protein